MRRPPPGRFARAERATEQRGVFRGDRQAQAAAAAVARRVGLVEALEDALEPVGRDARTAIRDRQDDRVAPSAASADLDRRARRVLAGVVEQVAEDPLEPARVGLDHERLVGQVERGLRQPGRGDRPRPAGRGRPARARSARRRASNREISIRSSTSVRSRPTSATSSSPARRLVGRQLVEVLAQDRRLGDERRQRRPQLVRDVGDEAPVLGLGRLEPADRVGRAPSAIRLKRSAHVPNSSSEVTGTRADRSPRSIRSAARLAASTGASTPRAIDPRDEQREEDQDQRRRR